ncbi:MAG: ArsR family transcriptional regulator [Pseudonocardiales bacterium]|nr:helix-turn-helix domain-containing protein [Actinomycetota bacterium]PZS19580.1 MAG: ArsR family transcriptional regulator [Pseudonocardiales bacterium]
MPPTSDPAGERSQAHGALASASRVHILNLLRGSGTPLDVAQIAALSALHPNTVRFHLKVLVDAGLACGRTDPQGASGRPRLVYTATTDGFGAKHPDHFQLLAEIFASYLAASTTIPTGLAEEAGRAFARRHQRPSPPFTGVSADEAVRRVVAMFAELGFEPELDRAGQDLQIRLHACPFLTLAGKYPEVVCSMHLGLLRGTLAELGAPATATSLRPFVEPHLCVAHITPSTEAPSDAENLPSVGKA